MATLTAGQDRERATISEQYKWNLADIYPDLAAWRAAKDAVVRELPRLRDYEDRLGSSPQLLADALDTVFRIDKEIARLSVYAGMLSDQDTREAGPQGMQQEMQQLAADFKAQTSYSEPELLRIGLTTLERCIEAEPRLQIYSFYLHDLARRARHTLSDSEEKLLADAMPMAASGHNIYNILANADFPYPTVTLSDGRTARVDPSGYAELRTLPNRSDRQTAMSTFFTSLGGFERTFGTMMNANVQRVAFYAKARKYDSHLEAARFRIDVLRELRRELALRSAWSCRSTERTASRGLCRGAGRRLRRLLRDEHACCHRANRDPHNQRAQRCRKSPCHHCPPY